MAKSKKKRHSTKKSFHCPFCGYSERSVRAKKFSHCPQCGKEVILKKQSKEDMD